MDKYVQKVAEKSESSILVIIAIIGLIIQIVSTCWPKPKKEEILSGGGLRGARAVNRALRESGIDPLSVAGKKIKQALLDEAPNADPGELAAFFSKCGVAE
jgi:hypothetical protein